MFFNNSIANFNEEPPTLFSIMQAIVNFGNEEQIKISDLSSVARVTIFDFDYPLSSHITKENFETMILDNFIMRRIGFETVTAFKIRLKVKLNEIMPTYNKMFDMLDGWDIFQNGESIIRNVTDTKNKNKTNNEIVGASTTDNSSASTNTSNSSTTSASSTEDKRKSDTPQNNLQDVQDGSYVSEYDYNTNGSQGSDSATSNGTSTFSNTNRKDSTKNSTDISAENGTIVETINKTQANKLDLYNKFIENRQNIYSMIFKDLECLFYQLV